MPAGALSTTLLHSPTPFQSCRKRSDASNEVFAFLHRLTLSIVAPQTLTWKGECGSRSPFNRCSAFISAANPTSKERAHAAVGGTHGSSGNPAARLDLTELAGCTSFFFVHGLASLQKTYKSGENRYYKFCQACVMNPLPASESVLCKFVSHLAGQKLKHHTITTYLCATRSGLGDPFMAPICLSWNILASFPGSLPLHIFTRVQ